MVKHVNVNYRCGAKVILVNICGEVDMHGWCSVDDSRVVNCVPKGWEEKLKLMATTLLYCSF